MSCSTPSPSLVALPVLSTSRPPETCGPSPPPLLSSVQPVRSPVSKSPLTNNSTTSSCEAAPVARASIASAMPSLSLSRSRKSAIESLSEWTGVVPTPGPLSDSIALAKPLYAGPYSISAVRYICLVPSALTIKPSPPVNSGRSTLWTPPESVHSSVSFGWNPSGKINVAPPPTSQRLLAEMPWVTLVRVAV